MSNTKKNYNDGCFSPDWLEVDLSDAARRQEVIKAEAENATLSTVNKEVRLESRRRKDLNTLLKELDEIKLSIEHATEKQHRLTNLVGFYTGELAQ